MSRRGLFYVDDASAALPEALPALTEVRDRGHAHRYVRHVRSSQAFALNLFAPLDDDGVRRVFVYLGHKVEKVEPPFFEYEDQQDRLQEASARSPHRTQVDVLLRGTTTEGRRIAALIEVKLSESNFGSCSAFDSAENTSPTICEQPGLFGGDAEHCFQIQNHGYGHRRYAEFLTDVRVTPPAARSDGGGCYLRDGRSQPMRNLALAHLLVKEGDYDEVVFALTAPRNYERIWRRFREFTSLFADTEKVTIRELPAEVVARRQPDGGTAFATRYGSVLNDHALLHLDTDGSLLGAWVHRDGHATSHYPDDEAETNANRSYAETVIDGEEWEALVDRLSRTSPHVAWWEAVACTPDESAEAVFRRVRTQGE
ncbi:MAG: hypothetical protein QM572_19490 [Nocardioides sp.]|uniref:PGN_0703 family putative restriction endonuclease n=1 Tax=Nocardioides sp. TaxID=35761 RepID=UPI0039E5DE09